MSSNLRLHETKSNCSNFSAYPILMELEQLRQYSG